MIGRAVLHYLFYRLGLEKPETQTTEKERAAIQTYALEKKYAVEIGVFEGVNTVLIAKSLALNAKLFAIDPFFKGKIGVCYHKLIAKHMLRKYRIQKKVNLLEKFSYEAINDVGNKIDFIFIDGDHSYEGLKRDWDDWFPKIKKNGYILLHDTNVPNHNPKVADLGSFQFFHKEIKDNNKVKIIETVDSLNVLQKLV